MKKEDVSGFIAYVMIVAIAIVFCFTVLREHSSESEMKFMEYWLFIIGSVALGVVINAVMFELAHIAGAKVGGYSVLSFSILGLTFTKNEDKWNFKVANFNGLTGETKIFPSRTTKEPNPKPFLLFGTLFAAIEIILDILLFGIMTANKELTWLVNFGYMFLTIGVVGVVILLYNIIPMKLDSVTDGYRLTMLKNPKNKIAFNELLRVEYEIAQGSENVEIKTFETITNFTADLNMNKVYALLDERNYDEAEKLIDLVINADSNDISHKTWLRAKAQKLYINIMKSSSIEEAQKFYHENADLKEVREISHDISMPSIRTYILISGLVERSHSETIYTLNNILKAYRSTPKNRRKTEMSLYNESLQKVLDNNPKWEDLKGYFLTEE